MAPPIGTPGCTGGEVEAGRTGALYTGRGPVCGTIMRGAGGGGATGFAATEGAAGVLAETAGGVGVEAAGTIGCVTGRSRGAGCGVATAAGGATGGATAGLAGIAGIGCCAVTGAAAGGTTGFAAGGTTTGRLTAAGDVTAGFSTGGCAAGACVRGGTARGAAGGATVSFCCVIAFSTSPGREMCDKSIFVLISSSPRAARELDFPAEDEPSAAERMYTRTFSASCSSRELECVFFSVTPTSGSVSRIALLLTSSSLARSLMRTLLIRPFVSPCCS